MTLMKYREECRDVEFEECSNVVVENCENTRIGRIPYQEKIHRVKCLLPDRGAEPALDIDQSDRNSESPSYCSKSVCIME